VMDHCRQVEHRRHRIARWRQRPSVPGAAPQRRGG
jgi:hypothetical protein